MRFPERCNYQEKSHNPVQVAENLAEKDEKIRYKANLEHSSKMCQQYFTQEFKIEEDTFILSLDDYLVGHYNPSPFDVIVFRIADRVKDGIDSAKSTHPEYYE